MDGLRIEELSVLLCFAVIHGVGLVFLALGLFDLLRYKRRAGDRSGRRTLSDTTYRPLSVLVPAHNKEEHIVRGVESLLTMGFPEFEVVVVNDGSDDEEVQLAELVSGLPREQIDPAALDFLASNPAMQRY